MHYSFSLFCGLLALTSTFTPVSISIPQVEALDTGYTFKQRQKVAKNYISEVFNRKACPSGNLKEARRYAPLATLAYCDVEDKNLNTTLQHLQTRYGPL
jgi:hypothetical protein